MSMATLATIHLVHIHRLGQQPKFRGGIDLQSTPLWTRLSGLFLLSHHTKLSRSPQQGATQPGYQVWPPEERVWGKSSALIMHLDG